MPYRHHSIPLQRSSDPDHLAILLLSSRPSPSPLLSVRSRMRRIAPGLVATRLILLLDTSMSLRRRPGFTAVLRLLQDLILRCGDGLKLHEVETARPRRGAVKPTRTGNLRYGSIDHHDRLRFDIRRHWRWVLCGSVPRRNLLSRHRSSRRSVRLSSSANKGAAPLVLNNSREEKRPFGPCGPGDGSQALAFPRRISSIGSVGCGKSTMIASLIRQQSEATSASPYGDLRALTCLNPETLLRDFYENVIVSGTPGSGKTTTSVRRIIEPPWHASKPSTLGHNTFGLWHDALRLRQCDSRRNRNCLVSALRNKRCQIPRQASGFTSQPVRFQERGHDATGLVKRLSALDQSRPFPYEMWFDQFRRRQPAARLVYDRVGSDEGIRRFLTGELDYAGSDWPLSKEQTNGSIYGVTQIPTVIGAVAPLFNLPGLEQPLRLSPDVLADMLNGTITQWDNSRLQADNAGVTLPAEPITIVHRSDGSGTTRILTEFLTVATDAWHSGAGFAVAWPEGSKGAKGNEGVAELVRKTPYALGYVEYLYAVEKGLPYAAVRNRSRRFVQPDIESLSAAVPQGDALALEPDQLALASLQSQNPRAYPITSFTWLLMPKRSPDETARGILLDFARWLLTSGQLLCTGLGYAPLPDDLSRRELDLLNHSL
jgi:phosphate transport system substrate-binding protein